MPGWFFSPSTSSLRTIAESSTTTTRTAPPGRRPGSAARAWDTDMSPPLDRQLDGQRDTVGGVAAPAGTLAIRHRLDDGVLEIEHLALRAGQPAAAHHVGELAGEVLHQRIGGRQLAGLHPEKRRHELARERQRQPTAQRAAKWTVKSHRRLEPRVVAGTERFPLDLADGLDAGEEPFLGHVRHGFVQLAGLFN